MEDGAGMARRRSQPLHPQIQEARRRSPRLHPQIEASEVARRRSPRLSPLEPASLPDSDDILRMILVRLSPQPSSLPRASAVCKRWRGLVTDPNFHRQFRAHHLKPPLLGFFDDMGNVFTSIMDPPDRIPPERFVFGGYSRNLDYFLVDCRHGLLLFGCDDRDEVAVCDPITGNHRLLTIPSELGRGHFLGAVLCAAGDNGHVHRGCHLGPFKVVLATTCRNLTLAWVYSSETGVWSDPTSSKVGSKFVCDRATMVGNALYWLPRTDGIREFDTEVQMPRSDQILEYDLDGQSIAAIEGPTVTNDQVDDRRLIIKGGDGVVGFAILSLLMIRTWQRNVNGHGIATWVPWKTIEMHTILGHPPLTGSLRGLLGYDEDNGVMLLYVNDTVYTVRLMSMQSRKLHKTHDTTTCYPFSSFYTPAIRQGDDADMLHDP